MIKQHISKAIFLVLLLSSNPLWAQYEGKIIKNAGKVELLIKDLSFAIDKDFQVTTFDSIRVGSNTPLSAYKVRVNSGDLHIRFKLNVKGVECKISLKQIVNLNTGKTFNLYEERIYGDLEFQTIEEQYESKTIVIANDANNSNPQLLSGDVRVVLEIEVLDYEVYETSFWRLPVKCNRTYKKWYQRPVVWIPPVVASGVGGGLLFKNKDYKPIYGQYKSYPSNDLLTEFAYDKANEIREKKQLRKNVGLGLLIASATWVGVQIWRDLERKGTCKNKCCANELDCGNCKGDEYKKNRKEKNSLGLKIFDHSNADEEANNYSYGSTIAIGIQFTF